MCDYELLVKELAKCNIYLARNISMNHNLKYNTYGKLQDLMVNKKKNVTFLEGAMNLYDTANKLCNNKLLIDKIKKVRDGISDSEIANLKVCSHWNPIAKTELEERANTILTNTLIETGMGMMGISDASEITGINKDTIKQACQDGRLFNTYKAGKIWIVDLYEVKEYWNIKEE